jgi:hypothetical protein
MRAIKRSEGYDLARDEKSYAEDVTHLFAEASPWNFKDTRFVPEFLLSWGHTRASC